MATTRVLDAKGINYGANEWVTREHLELDDILDASQPKKPGIDIFFLPGIESGPVKDAQFRQTVSDAFAIPSFFWSRACREANGFCSRNQDALPHYSGQAYSTSSRFLIKEIIPRGPEYGYDWQYMAFASLWYRPAPNAEESLVLLCFDLSAKMRGLVTAAFQESNPASWRDCPFGCYAVLAGVIAKCFDDALWGFREPVRNIEKSRISKAQCLNFDGMGVRYLIMHELARHIIHETETLEVTAATLGSIARHNTDFCGRHAGAKCTCMDDLDFYQSFVSNLIKRASSFQQRLHNEIMLSYNLFAADDNDTAKAILRETRNDGRDLTNLVSTLTLLFLPGTFFSGFFGMNFFQYGGGYISVSTSVWLFFATSVPITFFAFLAWFFYRGRAKQVEPQPHSAGWLDETSRVENTLAHTLTFPAPLPKTLR
ncbi:hypothetical protein CDD83_4285 [Cordyceps sp. RAO-2017]|nr:hypothetical protein CDD83_4285 [Cordyceps sp. RAO-2017]